MIRQCVICGAEFDTPPSSNKRTCSPACSAAWRSQQHKGRHNKWSASAKRNAAAAAEKTGNLAHGTKAALALPEGQRGPQNRNAKIWHLRTPDGEPVVVTNLTDWARQHTADFGADGGQRRCHFLRLPPDQAIHGGQIPQGKRTTMHRIDLQGVDAGGMGRKII